MAVMVFRAFSVIDGTLFEEPDLPRQSKFRHGDVAVILSNLGPTGGTSGPAWVLSIEIGTKAKGRTTVRQVDVPLHPFLTAEHYQESFTKPLSFAELAPSHQPSVNWLWLYRDVLYVTHREPMPSEQDEVRLRIKALHFQRDEELKRLKEQVANFEAIDANLRNGQSRRAIPDDVKLLVWSRDGGLCVKCGVSTDLHFDHIIPHVRGGSDEAENIQILCRTCNLMKADRLV